MNGWKPGSILPHDPFQSLDVEGVGSLVQTACDKGRYGRPGVKLGICGEHGGDPQSIQFCERVGLDYVSCSPYRVPVARLAAAQAVIAAGRSAGPGTNRPGRKPAPSRPKRATATRSKTSKKAGRAATGAGKSSLTNAKTPSKNTASRKRQRELAMV